MSDNTILGEIPSVIVNISPADDMPYNIDHYTPKTHLQPIREGPVKDLGPKYTKLPGLDPDLVLDELKRERRVRRKIN